MRRSQKNQFVYTVLLVLCIIGFWWFENSYIPASGSKGKAGAGKPAVAAYAMPSSTTGVRIDHSYFSLSYKEEGEQAEWVAYTLHARQLTPDHRERPWFIEDPKIGSKSADWRNYRRSGYNRGHLCPAGDRRFSEDAYNETFYTSNISPQLPEFNAGVWNRLEQQVRSWALAYKELQVVTGGVLSEGLPTIGEEKVAVPGSFYKIVIRGGEDSPKVLAFLLPHKESNRPLTDFLVTVDSLEQLTHIDFFPGLPDSVESKLESRVEGLDWEF